MSVGEGGAGQGLPEIPVELTGVTVVRAEIATLKAEPGAIHVCMPDFKTDTEKLSKEELLAKGFVVGRMVLAENAALGGLTLARGTEISFPDIFAHDDEDFQIVSGGVHKIGGLKLIATSSLPISIDAYEREKDAWKLREDRLLKISGHLADHATVSTLPLLAAHPISAIGGVDAVKTDQIDKLRLLLGTLASQAHFKTENADIRLDMKDTVVFTEKQVDDSWAQVYPVGVQWLRVDGQRVEAHALLTYSETTGDVLSFVPATAFKSNGMEIDAWPAKGPGLRSPPVTLYPGGKLASALSSKSQTVQGVKVDRTWNLIYFWDNGKLLHVARPRIRPSRTLLGMERRSPPLGFRSASIPTANSALSTARSAKWKARCRSSPAFSR